jgi:hypothetical protein
MKKNAQETTQHHKFAPLFKTETSRIKTMGKEQIVVTCHVARPDLLRQQPYQPFYETTKYRQRTEHTRYVTE